MEEGDRWARHFRHLWAAGGDTDCDRNAAGCRDQDDFDGGWGSLANTSGGVGGLPSANGDGRRRHGARTVGRRDGWFCSRTGMRGRQQRCECRADRGDTGLYWLKRCQARMVSLEKRARLTTVPVRWRELGPEDGRVEAGAILAGLGTVLDNDGMGVRGVDVAVCAGDHECGGGRDERERQRGGVMCLATRDWRGGPYETKRSYRIGEEREDQKISILVSKSGQTRSNPRKSLSPPRFCAPRPIRTRLGTAFAGQLIHCRSTYVAYPTALLSAGGLLGMQVDPVPGRHACDSAEL